MLLDSVNHNTALVHHIGDYYDVKFSPVSRISPPRQQFAVVESFSSLPYILLIPLKRSQIVELFLWYEINANYCLSVSSTAHLLYTMMYVLLVFLVTTLLMASLLVLTKGGWREHGCWANPEKELQLPTRDTSANGNDKIFRQSVTQLTCL